MIPGWLPGAAAGVHFRSDFDRRAAAAIEQLGDPLYAAGGEWLAEAALGGFGGRPCDTIHIRHGTGARQLEVSTGRRPLGGTRTLLHQLFVAVIQGDVSLPLDLRVEERLVMLAVGDGRQQFRVLEASTGHWVAAGGYRKRHLALQGTPGTSVDGLVLVPITGWRGLVSLGDARSS